MSREDKEQLKKKIQDDKFIQPMLEKIFKDSDLNKNGVIEKGIYIYYIYVDELSKLLTGIHENLNIPPPTKEDIDKELIRLDLNKDNVISKEELKTLVKDLALFTVEQMT